MKSLIDWNGVESRLIRPSACLNLGQIELSLWTGNWYLFWKDGLLIWVDLMILAFDRVLPVTMHFELAPYHFIARVDL